MTAAIYWRPISPKSARNLEEASWCPSDFIMTMKLLFGEPPWKIEAANTTHIERLKGASAATRDKHDPFKEILGILASKDAVEIWAEW